MIDLERVKAYIDLGFEKEEAMKLVNDEAKAEAKATAKAEAKKESLPPEINHDDIIEKLQAEVDSLRNQVQQNALKGATSDHIEVESAEDIMKRIYGGDNN